MKRKIKVSIKLKVTAIMVAIMTLSVACSGVFNYLNSARTVSEMTNSTLMQSNNDNSSMIRSLITKETLISSVITHDTMVSDVLSLSNSGTIPENDPKQAKLNEILQNIVSSTDEYEHIFIVNKSGIIVADSNPALLGVDVNDRAYTKATLSSGNPYISETLKSKSTGAFIVAFTYPLKENDEMIGFVATAVLADSLINNLVNTKILDTKSSYAYLVDEKGTMLYHPTKEKIGIPVENEQVQQIVKRVQAGEEVKPGIITYLFKDKQKMASFSIIPETKWILVVTGDMEEVMSPVTEVLFSVLIIGIIIIVIAGLIAFISALQIAKPIIKLTELIERTARLDLKYDDKYVHLGKKNDETGAIAVATIETRSVLREMAEKLQTVSSSVLDNAKNLKVLSDSVLENAQDNSATTEQLSAGTEESAASAEEISATIQMVEDNVDHIADKTKEGADISRQITEKAKVLRESAINSTSEAKRIYNEVRLNMENAIKESDNITQINALADAIHTITEQTNLLALNAAIEAARAGESGKGFAVVADEIRKMAEESSRTAASIQGVVKNVHTSVGNIRDNSSKMLTFVDQKVLPDYEGLIRVSEQYNSDASVINDMMSEFEKTSGELSEAVTNIATAINEVAMTATESAKGVEDIAEKTSEIRDKTSEVSKLAEENTESVQGLQDLVSKFTI